MEMSLKDLTEKAQASKAAGTRVTEDRDQEMETGLRGLLEMDRGPEVGVETGLKGQLEKAQAQGPRVIVARKGAGRAQGVATGLTGLPERAVVRERAGRVLAAETGRDLAVETGLKDPPGREKALALKATGAKVKTGEDQEVDPGLMGPSEREVVLRVAAGSEGTLELQGLTGKQEDAAVAVAVEETGNAGSKSRKSD